MRTTNRFSKFLQTKKNDELQQRPPKNKGGSFQFNHNSTNQKSTQKKKENPLKTGDKKKVNKPQKENNNPLKQTSKSPSKDRSSPQMKSDLATKTENQTKEQINDEDKRLWPKRSRFISPFFQTTSPQPDIKPPKQQKSTPVSQEEKKSETETFKVSTI